MLYCEKDRHTSLSNLDNTGIHIIEEGDERRRLAVVVELEMDRALNHV